MNTDKKNKIMAIFITVAAFLVLGGIGFAFFSSAVSNDNNEKFQTSTATMSLKFDDNDNGISANLNLGESVTKKFTLENTGTVDAYAKIKWHDLVNTYMNGSLSYTLEQSTSENGTYEYVDTRIPELVIGIIKAMDPKGEEISHEYKYETDNLYTAFYIMLYDIISINNWYVKICGNCGRYFITPKATISYCDRIVDGELTCKDVGSKEQQKRKMKNNPVLARFRQIQQIKCTYSNRYKDEPFYKKDYEEFNKKGNEFKAKLKKGKITEAEFDKWLDTQDKTKQD